MTRKGRRRKPSISSLAAILLLSSVEEASATPVRRRIEAPSPVWLDKRQASEGDGMAVALQNLVMTNLDASANASWEWGTRTEALLELSYPSLSIFSPITSPLPPDLFSAGIQSTPADLLAIIDPILAARPRNATQLTPDGSAGDPASLGVAVLLANATTAGNNASYYGTAAAAQLKALLTATPRTPDGAISHRVSQLQLWADFIYMGPPFIAYYGAMTLNATLLTEAYDQCRLYRQYLQDNTTKLWRHIVLGNDFQDLGLWSTGNGWAASGMMRVAATLDAVPSDELKTQFQSQKQDLWRWTAEIVNAAWTYQTESGLLRNYINDTTSFEDAAGTAMLSAATYRLAAASNSTLPQPASLNSASRARLAIQANNIDPSTGWVSPVVNPLRYDTVASPTQHSPEAQAFVILMQTAWRDWSVLVPQNQTSGPGPGGDSGPGPASAGKRAAADVSTVLMAIAAVFVALCRAV